MKRLAILLVCAGAALAQRGLPQLGFRVLVKPPTGQQVLTQGDFAYLGAFTLPATTSTGKGTESDGTFLTSGGLTGRYTGGVLHLFTTAGTGFDLVEWTVPTLKTSAPYNDATEVKSYSSIYGTERVNSDTGTSVSQYGITCDTIQTCARLYWLYGGSYTNVEYTSIGYSTLDFAAGTGVAAGSWDLTAAGNKAYDTELLLFPASWAAAYGGKRLGGCCGGYFNLLGAHDGSLGPTAIAFNPPTVEADHSSLASTALLGFWPTSDIGGTRMPRPGAAPAIDERFETPSQHRNSEWTWTDGFYGGLRGCPIDTGTKWGLLYAYQLGVGVVAYNDAEIAGDAEQHWWGIIDPADLTRVYTGALAKDAVRFNSTWAVQYPEYNYSAYPFSVVTKTVSSVTATGSGPFTTPVTVVAPNHGLSTGDKISISGTSPSDFNVTLALDPGIVGCGTCGVIDTNTFRASTQNGTTFSAAATSTGGLLNKQWHGPFFWTPAGMFCDSTTNRVFISMPGDGGALGKQIIHVWQPS